MFRSTHAHTHTQTALCKAVQFREIRGRVLASARRVFSTFLPFGCAYIELPQSLFRVQLGRRIFRNLGTFDICETVQVLAAARAQGGGALVVVFGCSGFV